MTKTKTKKQDKRKRKIRKDVLLKNQEIQDALTFLNFAVAELRDEFQGMKHRFVDQRVEFHKTQQFVQKEMLKLARKANGKTKN